MGKKLLVADDSLTIQKVIKLALSHDGYEIQTVADGNELMAQVSLFRPDVILIDLGLPGKSTFDVKKELNQATDLKDIPCVLMASAFEKVDEAKVALLQFDGRLTKPFDPSHLREVLQKAMNSRGIPENFDPANLPPPPARKKEGLPKFAPEEIPVGDTISLHDPLWSPDTDLPQADESGSTGIDSISPIGNIEMPKLDLGPEAPIYHAEEKTDEVDLGNIPAMPSTDDTDIRHLTESTVRMSGLDDLAGWNINETARSSLPPIPTIFDQTRLNIETNASPYTNPPMNMPSPARSPIPPAPGRTPPPPPTFGSSAPSSSPAPAPRAEDLLAELPTSKEIEEMVEKQVRAQLEEMVQQQVSIHLEKFVKSGLPDLAERIVKQEIRKLLEGLG